MNLVAAKFEYLSLRNAWLTYATSSRSFAFLFDTFADVLPLTPIPNNQSSFQYTRALPLHPTKLALIPQISPFQLNSNIYLVTISYIRPCHQHPITLSSQCTRHYYIVFKKLAHSASPQLHPFPYRNGLHVQRRIKCITIYFGTEISASNSL